MIKKILRSSPYFSEEDIQSTLKMIESSLRSGLLTMGPIVRQFEDEFAKYVGVKHAIAVSSGASALEIALRCIGVLGKEVIVPTETFVASANSVILAGGKPVFAEVDPTTLCLDLNDVKRKINSKTIAVMIVHMAGLISPDIDHLNSLCDRNGLILIEDAAHAHGASIGQKCAGNIGQIGCFSFYPTKIITSSEGGMITTNNDNWADVARSMRNHGANLKGSDHVYVSTNWRMSEPNAAIGLVQLRRLGEFLNKRNSIASYYNEKLGLFIGIKPLPVYSGVRHGYWNYIAMLDEHIDRTILAQVLLKKFGIQVAWPYEPLCHLQPVFRNLFGYKTGDLPQSELALSHHIALPMHVGLNIEDVEYVVSSLEMALKEINI